MKKTIIIFLLIFGNLLGQNKWSFDENYTPRKPLSEFQFLAYFFTQGVFNNIYAKNDLLKGQTVGRLFGGNTTNTGQQSLYFEQRLIPFIIYQYHIVNNGTIIVTAGHVYFHFSFIARNGHFGFSQRNRRISGKPLRQNFNVRLFGKDLSFPAGH